MKSKSIGNTKLIEALWEKTGIPVRDVRTVVRGLFHLIRQQLTTGNPVTIEEFGLFHVKARKGRTAVLTNVKTKEKYTSTTPDCPYVKFTGSRTFKQQLKADMPAERLKTILANQRRKNPMRKQ